MLTTDDALVYLGIDYADEAVKANVTRALKAAEQRMRGAVGSDVETVLQGDPRIDQLVLLYTAENYDERGASVKQGNARSHLSADLELQLRVELARAKESGVT